MDTVYERLYSYNFKTDERFLLGWKRVKGAIPQDKIAESLLKAQTFYYSREVEPVNVDTYKQWLKDHNLEFQFADLLEVEETAGSEPESSPGTSVKESPGPNDKEKNVNNIIGKKDDQQNENKAIMTQNESERYPASFMDLVAMIEQGLKLPDMEDLNIEPLNKEPAPCAKTRPKKPWEET